MPSTSPPTPHDYPTVPLKRFDPGVPAERAARAFYETMRLRRTVREFSDRPVSEETIRQIVAAAGTAPSGANKQPWRFVAVCDPALKRRIREAAEAEEREFYSRRATPEWLADLAPLGTGCEKPFLERAPWLIVVFKTMKADDGGGVYYVNESVGIAVGLLLAAAHHAGLATLTHTPSPMGFLSKVLARPEHERPFLVVPVGYPEEGCRVPDIGRKAVDQILVVNLGGEGPRKTDV
ncbi:3-hydroxypropanoate dehydrogenase [Phycisphaerales bacterium]|nr:3-hydroxypropanoate dehydrogenase [Phycisphaerales bacterium]